MAALSFTAANVSADQNQGAVIRNFEAASAVSVGKPVYVNSDGKIALADANVSETEARAVGLVVNSADMHGATDIAAGARASVCVFGPVYGFSGLAEGTYAWVGATAGELVDTAPTGGAYQFIVGQALASDVFFVNPGTSKPASA